MNDNEKIKSLEDALIIIAQFQRGGVIEMDDMTAITRDSMIGIARQTLDSMRVKWRKKHD
jgi:hypothetical protein